MRITGGEFGGRNLKVPKSDAIRPTQDRVREALVRETDETGYLPTFWFNHRQDWPNCMVSSSNALAELGEALK